MEFLKRDTRIDFIGRRRIAAVISIVIIVIGFSSLFFRGLNLGIDFTGGTLVEVSYNNSVSAEEVRKNLQFCEMSKSCGKVLEKSWKVLGNLLAKVLDKGFGNSFGKSFGKSLGKSLGKLWKKS